MRIVSLNLCTDQLVLQLVEPKRIRSVTWMARDPAISVMVDEATRVPVNYGRAEEVLAAKPDLVLAGRYTYTPTMAVLKRLGVAVTIFELPSSLADVRAQIETAAAALDERERGQALIAILDRQIAAAGADAPTQRAVVGIRSPGGGTSGPGTLTHEVVLAAGYDNLAARLGIKRFAVFPLEHLVWAMPDRLLAETAYGEFASLTTGMAQHPALDHVGRRIRLPSRLMMCAGPSIGTAAEQLAHARR
jgi:iron complex transport system substrate-binding protein